MARKPTLSVLDATGNEDGVIALSIDAALVNPKAGDTLSIVISGVPAGTTLSAGIDNGDGSWTLTPGELIGLNITPPSDSDVDFALTVTAINIPSNGPPATTVGTLNVTVDAVADTPTLTVGDATGEADSAIPLDISALQTDLNATNWIL